MGTFLDTLLPALSGDAAKVLPAGMQGQGQGMQLGQQLALLKQQLEQQQLAMEQSRVAFPLQQQQIQQQVQLGHQLIPLELQGKRADIGYKEAQAKQANALAGMYQGGLYPPGSIDEQMKRRLADNPGDVHARRYFATMSRTKLDAAAASGIYPLDDQTLGSMADLANQDASYHPTFSGPWGPINQQRFNTLRMNPQAPAQNLPGMPEKPPVTDTPAPSGPLPASAILERQAKTKLMKETVSDFGSKGKSGQQVRSLNTALNHLGTVEQLANALQMGDIRLINKAKYLYELETGEPAPASFAAAVGVVGDEFAKAMVGAGLTSEGDRSKVAATVSAYNSPSQWLGPEGVGRTYRRLFVGKLKELERQYVGAVGGTPDASQAFRAMLSPTVQQMYGEVEASEKGMVSPVAPAPIYSGKRPALTPPKSGPPASGPRSTKQFQQDILDARKELKGKPKAFYDAMRQSPKLTPSQKLALDEAWLMEQGQQ